MFNYNKEGKGLRHWLNNMSLKTHNEIASKGKDFAKKKEKNLGKTRKKENNISSDEVTGEPMEGNGDFHHKNKKTIYTDPVQRLNPNKGILVNKQTHRDIHKNNINNEEDLNKYIKERRESK